MRSHAEEKVSVVLVGNMYDLVADEEEEQQLTTPEGERGKGSETRKKS